MRRHGSPGWSHRRPGDGRRPRFPSVCRVDGCSSPSTNGWRFALPRLRSAIRANARKSALFSRRFCSPAVKKQQKTDIVCMSHTQKLLVFDTLAAGVRVLIGGRAQTLRKQEAMSVRLRLSARIRPILWSARMASNLRRNATRGHESQHSRC